MSTRKIFKIEGMSCHHCEDTIERSLKTKGILKVEAHHAKKFARIEYDQDMVSEKEIKQIINEAGYQVTEVIEDNGPDKKTVEIAQFVGITIALLGIYFLIQKTVGFNFIPQVNSTMGFGMIFVVGLITSLHCVAMCGGISISQCVEKEGNKYTNGIFYNAGRVVSYTILGGIIGALGSVFNFSPAVKGGIALGAGILMVFVGLRMAGVFSFLKKIKIPGSDIFSKLTPKKAGLKAYRYGPFFVGLLNGLMPCAPLQAMQLYALGTGSALTGALSMFFFSLGTVPLVFGLGTAASLFTRKFSGGLIRISAIIVIFLGLVMVNRGMSLSGKILLPVAANGNTAEVQNGIQVIRSVFKANSYAPITVQKGIPVKWIISIADDDLNGCNGTMIIPEYNINKKLAPGENIVNFTPARSGTIGYSCWMGMIRSSITVVEGRNNSSAIAQTNTDTPLPNAAPVTDSDIFVSKSNGIEEVKIHVNATGYTPRMIVLKKNTRARFTFIVDQLSGCNTFVVFPEYRGGLDLSKGQTQTPELNITQDFHIRCGMGMLNATVKVVDDPSKIDREALKKQAAAIVSGQTGGCCSISPPRS